MRKWLMEEVRDWLETEYKEIDIDNFLNEGWEDENGNLIYFSLKEKVEIENFYYELIEADESQLRAFNWWA